MVTQAKKRPVRSLPSALTWCKRIKLPADKEGYPLNRLQTLRDLGVDVGIWWYADYPSHDRGEWLSCNRGERGSSGREARARAFAKVIRAIKDDTSRRSVCRMSFLAGCDIALWI